MNPHLAIALSIVLVLPSVASAAVSAPPTTGAPPMTSTDMGEFLGAVRFCEDATPNHRTQIRENVERLIDGLSENRIEAMKGMPDFKIAYDNITGYLRVLQKDQVAQICDQLARGADFPRPTRSQE